jgi:cytoskeleton protein RodZ
MAMFKQKQRNRSPDSVAAEADGSMSAGDSEIRDSSAGGLLRRTREGFGWNLRDVAASLRIRAEYLEALERNTVEGLPGPTYATGFLRAYAEYLGLDGHEIVRRFREEKTGLYAKPELAFPVPLTERGIPGSGIFLIAVLLAGLGYGTYYYATSGDRSTQKPIEPPPQNLLPPPPAPPPSNLAANPAPPVASVEPPKPADGGVVPPPTTPAAATPPAGATPPPAAVAAAPPPSPAALADADTGKPGKSYGAATPGRIVVRANANAWVTVKDGDKAVVNALFTKGDFYNAPDHKGLTLRTGNAGALEVTVDGRALPPLGPLGQIRTVPLDPDKLAHVSSPAG